MIPILDRNDIHPDTIEINDTPAPHTAVEEITRVAMDEFFQAILVLGEETSLSDLQTLLSDTLNIPTIQLMRAENSDLFEGKISRVIRDAILEQNTPIRTPAFHDPLDLELGVGAFELLDKDEITKLLDALDAMDGSQGTPIVDLFEVFDVDNITTQKLLDVIQANSVIIRTMISEVVIDAVTEDRVVPAAYEHPVDYPDLTQAELIAFGNSIGVIDETYNNGDDLDDQSIILLATELGNNVDTLKLGQLYDLHQESSLIMRKFISEGIVIAVTLAAIREDAFEIVAMEFIEYDEITRLLDTLIEVADSDPLVVDPLEQPLAGVADLITAESVTPELLVK